MLAIVLMLGGVSVAWLAGVDSIHNLFAPLDRLQQSPPDWLEVPRVAKHYLLAPTIMLLLVALAVMKISPEPRQWSRMIVVTILLVLTARYTLWRSLATLNLSTPLNGIFSLGLLLLELLMLFRVTIQLVLTVRMRDRRKEADVKSIAVVEKFYTPSVDILIPTYNEPDFILRRTVVGCQAIDYPNKRIYLLDDTHRPEIRALATELGCEYRTRPDNRHAKAGNLNHAIAHTHGELIVVFDADFVPTRNFLTRTVGFFQDEWVGLVQTPQSFYNTDPTARNLGLEDVLIPEDEVFYRQIQPIRDGAGSVICSGTSFVVRRKALESVGGFVTESLSEDYFTGIRLSAQGYRLVYLDEKLSAGLAADSIAAQAVQRLRWARGTLQAFFISANPLTIPGLTLVQRLAHLEGLLHWFSCFVEVGFLLMPLAYAWLHVIPLRSSLAELLYFFLPYYVVQLAVFAWLNHRSRSAVLSSLYSLVLAVPIAITVVQVMLNPFSKGFQVTPKGIASDRYSYNWKLALPLIGLLILTATSLWQNLSLSLLGSGGAELNLTVKGLNLGWIWSAYNLMMISIALLILLDAPKPDRHEWFDLRRTVRLSLNGTAQPFWGVTTLLSEAGAEVALTQTSFPVLAAGESLPIELELLEENLTLRGLATGTATQGEFPTARIQFKPVSLEQQRRLIEILFCRPGQWKRPTAPGEWRSLLLLFQILLRPKALCDRTVKVRAIAVAKG
jgi:cellulose synthase (UDP-forming)